MKSKEKVDRKILQETIDDLAVGNKPPGSLSIISNSDSSLVESGSFAFGALPGLLFL